MRFVLGIGLALLGMSATVPRSPATATATTTYHLALLVEGPDDTPLGERAIQALQEAHLAYVRREIERGTIVLAGRLDANGLNTNIRSAVLLDVDDVATAHDVLARDPWVRAGRVTPQLSGWRTEREVLGTAPDVLRTERCYLALYRSPELPRTYDDERMLEIESGHRAAVRRLADGEDLVLDGPTIGSTAIREIVLLRAADMERILAVVKDDPYLTMGIAGFEIYPWHVPTGALP